MVTTKEFKDVLSRIIPYDHNINILINYEGKIYPTYEVFSDTGHDICFTIDYNLCGFDGVNVGEVCTLVFMTNPSETYFFEVLTEEYTTTVVEEIEYRSDISAIILSI